MKKLDKKYIIIGALVIVILVVVLFIALKPKDKENQEELLTNRLKELGVDFYENFYYDQLGTKVSKYEDTGIKVDLDNLSRYDTTQKEAILSEFVNKETNKSCDKEKTGVVIKPKEPYDKKSYEIEVTLECGFEKK